MRTVTWRKLTLHGFGPYRDQTVVDLDEGINTLVAENEAGKSTLVAGLAAVLFGLPESSDPEEFGKTRYRNWHGPSRFEGELEFTVDGNAFRIQRNFDTNRVVLCRRENGRWVEEATGEHNPKGRRRNITYEARLGELLGITSRDLFEATFCLTQPLPGSSEIDADVQRLLSGAGTYHEAARETLVREMKGLTRFTGRLGATVQDGRKDSRLEELEAEITGLEGNLHSSRTAVDSLQATREEIAGAQRALENNEGILAARERVLQAWTEWRSLRERYQSALARQRQAQDALDRARALEGELDRQRRALQAEYPPDEAPETWGRLGSNPVAALQTLRQLAATARRDWVRFETERRRLQGAEEVLAGEFAVLEAASPGMLEHLRSYDKSHEALAREVEAARTALAAAHQQVDEYTQLKQRFEDLFGEPGGRHAGRFARAVAAAALTALVFWLAWGRTMSPGPAILASLAAGAAAGVVAWALATSFELGRTRERLRSRAEAARALDAAAASLPDEAALARLERRLSTAEAGRSEFEAATRKAAEAFGDVGAAYARWEKIRAERDAALATVTGFARDEFGTGPAAVADLPLPGVGGRWAELAVLAGLMGADLATVGQLATWLEGLDAADWQRAEDQAREWEARRQKRSIRQQEIESLDSSLRGLLEGQGATSVDDLSQRTIDAGNQAAAALAAWQTLIDANPGLPGAGEAGDPAALDQRFRNLQDEVNGLRQAVREAESRIRDLNNQLGYLEGQKPLNVAEAELRLRELERERDRLKLEIEALAIAYRELVAAVETYHSSHRDRLARAATRYLAGITGVDGREVLIDEDFRLSFRDADGGIHAVSQLSQGTQDQLYVALRLAVADLVAGEFILPFIFDDPFLNCDGGRLERIRQTLATLAGQRQVFLLSHRGDLACWGHPAGVAERR